MGARDEGRGMEREGGETGVEKDREGVKGTNVEKEAKAGVVLTMV
jgi:hypothetical protein